MKLIIVSGLSGAGKSVALHQLEDMGFFAVDNLPIALFGGRTRSTVEALKTRYPKMAVGIDARESAEEIERFPVFLDYVKERGIDVQVFFFTADTDVILQRYNDTRRKHPLTNEKMSLSDAVEEERSLLAPIANNADALIDTSHFNVHKLRDHIKSLVEISDDFTAVTIESFGFKNGVPDGLDFVFDVRCLPNPHWQKDLRNQTGRDAGVSEFLGSHPQVQGMIDDISGFLRKWLPEFQAQNRPYVTIGIGCTGGQHRSVYVAERLKLELENEFQPMTVFHRELN